MKLVLAAAALCAFANIAHAADGTCSTASQVTYLGVPPDRRDMLKTIDAECKPGDKITLPKFESWLVSQACDLNKPVIDLGPRLLCVLRDPHPAATKPAKRA